MISVQNGHANSAYESRGFGIVITDFGMVITDFGIVISDYGNVING